ncbi:MAG: PAS domain-containing sensor histidine kinase [Saprospiraceae bacterium]|uniref:Sensor protein FixL n=1 Tax=Candidatus Opimibacter skivensis TaxID=2982028 RepID=A0A9D7SS32_9BACT|nr:PAS domain-containing sensor histidine kinase [Candidatus Opimibacter skivensis]
MKSIVETAIDGIFLIDTEGMIVMVNPAAIMLFGYERADVLGQNISLLMPSPHKELHHSYVHNYLNTGIKKIIGIGREIEGRHKNGSLFPARLAVSEIILNDQHYFTGIIHDLSDVKTAENNLINLNQELETNVIERTIELQNAVNRLLDTNQLLNKSIDRHKASEAALLRTQEELKKSLEKEQELGLLKSRFMSMASHEFKTPLSSILSSAALITRYDKPEKAFDRNRHVEKIKASVTHLNNILTDFLSINRLEEGYFEPMITHFSLDAFLSDLESEMEGMLKSGQQLLVRQHKMGIDIFSDKNMLRNILYNLLSNAIKYSEENKAISLWVHQRDQMIEMEIQDEGMGIPDEDQKYIGSRFFRASNAMNIQGTGLGLNIVNSCLALLNGTMSFTSSPGNGTTFMITIPISYEK